MTAADMYRNISGNPGVLCIDETENFQGERGEALKEILKTGYYKGVHVSRQRQQADGLWISDKFATYSPKALASINPLDPVTQQRTLMVHMRPALRSITEFKADWDIWKNLKNDLHIFALENAKDIAKHYDEWSRGHRHTRAPGLINRAWEITAPIVVLADYIGGADISDYVIEWLSRYYIEAQTKSDSTDLIRLLALTLPSYIKDNVAHDGWYYPVRTITENLKSFMDEDTSEKVTTRSITRWLTPLGFGDVRAAKGGKLVRIEENELRKVFVERRLTPYQGDIAWLEGVVDYQTPDRVAQVTTQSTVTWGDEE
jgi:hypothetical protein